jgi:hypothetical protein
MGLLNLPSFLKMSKFLEINKDEANVVYKYKGKKIQSNLVSKMELQVLLDAQKLAK